MGRRTSLTDVFYITYFRNRRIIIKWKIGPVDQLIAVPPFEKVILISILCEKNKDFKLGNLNPSPRPECSTEEKEKTRSNF